MTPMQKFAIEQLESYDDERGMSPNYLAARWREHKGKGFSCASRDNFGNTSAAYRTLRNLAEQGKVRVEITRTDTGWHDEMYFANKCKECETNPLMEGSDTCQ